MSEDEYNESGNEGCVTSSSMLPAKVLRKCEVVLVTTGRNEYNSATVSTFGLGLKNVILG